MKKLIKKHEKGSVIDSFTKSKAYNSLPATAIKIFDPTGISSWGDVYNAWTDDKFDYNDVLEPLGAIPVLGKLGKVGKYLGKGIKGLNDLSDAKKVIAAGNKVVDVVGGTRGIRGLRGETKVLARQRYFNPAMEGAERIDAFDKLHKLSLAERTLNQNKLTNRIQYGVRAGASTDDVLDVKNSAANTLSSLRK